MNWPRPPLPFRRCATRSRRPLSGFFTAIAGALFALLLGRVAPESFNLNQLLLGFAMVMVGGMGTVAGPVLGAILLTAVPEFLRNIASTEEILYSFLLIGLLLFMPSSLFRRPLRADPKPARAASRSRLMTPRLKLEHVGVQFAGLRAVSDVSFEVAPGEICAVIGPNGAGKSTLFNAIGGYVRSTGDVYLNGALLAESRSIRWPLQASRRTFQNGGLFQDLTVMRNVMVGLHQTYDIPLIASALGLPSAKRMESEAIRRARAMLDLMGILKMENILLRDLSSGQRRIVEIARALVVPAKLLMLDEPAVGLTTLEIERLDQILKTLARDGISVLLVEHVLDLVMSVSDKVVVLNSGEKLAEGTHQAEVKQDPAVLEAYLGYSELCSASETSAQATATAKSCMGCRCR